MARIPRAPRVEWLVILIAALIGAYSVPLLIANAEEKTMLLGISYAWLTLPMTVGSALFVLHAGLALLRRPAGTAALARCSRSPRWSHCSGSPRARSAPSRACSTRCWRLLFFALVAVGAPIGFVLATVGIACVFAAGSADMIGVVMNAQRGIERVHLPRAAVLHPGGLHHGPRRHRRAHRRTSSPR